MHKHTNKMPRSIVSNGEEVMGGTNRYGSNDADTKKNAAAPYRKRRRGLSESNRNGALTADESDGADGTVGETGKLLGLGELGQTGGAGGGTESSLILGLLLVSNGLRGGEGDGGANQADEESLAERHRIALNRPAGTDDEQGVDGCDGCGDVLLHFGAPFPWCVSSDELNIQLRPAGRDGNGKLRG